MSASPTSTSRRYREFCDSHLGQLDEVLVDYVSGPDFDRVLVDTIVSSFPAREREQFVAHYRGLLRAWAQGQG
jgi:hypothetical protein